MTHVFVWCMAVAAGPARVGLTVARYELCAVHTYRLWCVVSRLWHARGRASCGVVAVTCRLSGGVGFRLRATGAGGGDGRCASVTSK